MQKGYHSLIAWMNTSSSDSADVDWQQIVKEDTDTEGTDGIETPLTDQSTYHELWQDTTSSNPASMEYESKHIRANVDTEQPSTSEANKYRLELTTSIISMLSSMKSVPLFNGVRLRRKRKRTRSFHKTCRKYVDVF